MNNLLTVTLLLIILAASPASTAELTCPKAPPFHDWKGFRLETSQIQALKGGELPKSLGAVEAVSIFDGSPTEMADLVPDNPEAFGRAPQVWTLPIDTKRSVWVVCRYKKSTVAFGKELPPGVRTCSVAGSAGKVFKIRCQ
jgi:hypothetical protein